MNHKENAVQFWDTVFKDSKPLKINPKEVKVENTLDEYLKKILIQSVFYFNFFWVDLKKLK